MHKLIKKLKSISNAEFLSIFGVLFLIYVFIISPMINNFKHTQLKRKWINAYIKLNAASRQIAGTRGFQYLFDDEKSVIRVFSNYVNPIKTCDNSQKEGCWSKPSVIDSSKPGMIIPGGAFVVPEITSPECEESLNGFQSCGAINVDINGDEKPNVIGKDILKIYILRKKITPAGVKGDVLNPSYNCEFGKKYDWGCSAKYLERI